LKNIPLKCSETLVLLKPPSSFAVSLIAECEKSFDPTIDRKNQEKCKPKKEIIKISKARRYQPYDTQAPISGRQRNKRKEEKKSQDLETA